MALPLVLLIGSLLAQSVVGVGVAVGVAAVAGLGLWVRRSGFDFVQLVAFLIHFDGIGAGPLSIGRVMAFIAIVVFAHKLVVERWRPPAVPVRSWAPVLAMSAWVVVGGAWSPARAFFLLALGIFFLGVTYFVITGFLVDSFEKVERYLRAYWYGGLFGVIAGVIPLVLGVRAFGFNGGTNTFGMLMASMIPLTVYYRRQQTDPRGKLLYGVILLAVIVGAAGAGSRSGIIGATLATFFSIITRPGLSGGRRARLSVGAALLSVVLGLVLFVANPANLERGLGDRGAGRLDIWAVAGDLIPEQPIIGFGAGQFGQMIVPYLPLVPGVREIRAQHEVASAHNTWLDVQSDYGLVGLTLFTTIYVVAIVNLLRPRWQKHRQVSSTLMIMMVPVLSSSMFIPLLNNKLAWSIIGLSAALQVPSWGTRWSGYFDPRRAGSGGAALAVRSGSKPVGRALSRRRSYSTRVEPKDLSWTETTLARWDLKVSRRFRYYLVVGGLVGMIAFGVGASLVPTKHVATASVIIPILDGPANAQRVDIDTERSQVLHTFVLSAAYSVELAQRSGVGLSPPEIRERMWAERPESGPLLVISYTDTDRARAEKVAPHLLDSLSAVIEAGREYTAPQLAEELRPMYPGERRYYQGELFLPITDEPIVETNAKSVGVTALFGAMGGTLVAVGLILLQQRRPRVNNNDDFPTAVGMPLLTHVGRTGRRYAATRQQYQQVAVNALELGGVDAVPRRILVAGPAEDPAARGLAMGVAAALAASGRRVVLVDGQPERPRLTWRLGGWRGPGMVEVSRGEVELSAAVRYLRQWRLPSSVRRALGSQARSVRFVPAGGRRHKDRELRVDPAVLDVLDESVVVVMLAPPLLGVVPSAPSLRWADVTLYCLVEGRTVTFDAEDGAVRVRTFARGPSGVVLADV